MTRVILAVKNNQLIESIREIVFNILQIEFNKEKSVQKENLPDSKKIVRSSYNISDEFGYFNKIEH